MRFPLLVLTVLASLAARPAPACGAPPTASTTALSPQAIDQSLELGRRYLLNSQRSNGSFIYEMDAARGTDFGTRNSVREMGALWSLAAFHRHKPNPETAAAILKSLKHHDGHAKTAGGMRFLCEPKAREGATNTMALYVLTLLDFLAADFDLPAPARADYESKLNESVKFLMSLRLTSGRFASRYRCPDGRPFGEAAPHSDGEALLALARAAKTEGNESMRDAVLESGAVMYGWYVRSGLRANPNNLETNGFYQWGSMAFYELYTSGWPETQAYAGRTIALARWLIDVRKLLESRGNAGYAFEGLAVAWELARLTKDTTNQQYIGAAIDGGLSKLMTWQIGSPSAGEAVPKSFLTSPKVRGGVLTVEGDRRLRVDVTQHQMHALMLVRWFMFRADEAE